MLHRQKALLCVRDLTTMLHSERQKNLEIILFSPLKRSLFLLKITSATSRYKSLRTIMVTRNCILFVTGRIVSLSDFSSFRVWKADQPCWYDPWLIQSIAYCACQLKQTVLMLNWLFHIQLDVNMINALQSGLMLWLRTFSFSNVAFKSVC